MNKHFEALLKMILNHGASDLHMVADQPLYFRVDGFLSPMDATGYTNEDIEGMIKDLLDDTEWRRYMSSGDYETSVTLPDSEERFRVAIYRERGNHCLAIRHIRSITPTFAELGLPDTVAEDLNHKTGLILVTGPAGSGKSTTLSAMIHWFNTNRQYHIITIEDPIEHYHKSRRSLISQRQVGDDTRSFNAALTNALRQDPDVLVVGEMRDLETVRLVITAAETGHLVLATLHSIDAVQSITRIIDVFPAEFQDQVRLQLASSLRAIYSQRLLPGPSGTGRVLALEVLRQSPQVSYLIRTKKEDQIPNYLTMNVSAGNISFKQSIRQLLSAGYISRDVADEYLRKTATTHDED